MWCIRSYTSVSRKGFIKPRHAQDGQTHLWGTDRAAIPIFHNLFKQNSSFARYHLIFQEFPLSSSITDLSHCLCATQNQSSFGA